MWFSCNNKSIKKYVHCLRQTMIIGIFIPFAKFIKMQKKKFTICINFVWKICGNYALHHFHTQIHNINYQLLSFHENKECFGSMAYARECMPYNCYLFCMHSMLLLTRDIGANQKTMYSVVEDTNTSPDIESRTLNALISNECLYIYASNWNMNLIP